MVNRVELALIVKLVTGMPINRSSSHQGFTLIEVLVVLVIISITIGFALLSFGDFGRARKLTTTAETFKNQLQLIQEQAMLESATYGLQVNGSQLKTLRFDRMKGWQIIQTPFLKKNYHFPDSVVIRFESSQHDPSIIFYSTGEITPFRFTIGNPPKANSIQIIGEPSGHIQLKSDLKT